MKTKIYPEIVLMELMIDFVSFKKLRILGSMFYSKEVSIFRKFEEAHDEHCSLPNGIFAGNYSVHGIELINVEVRQEPNSSLADQEEDFFIKGVKMTGDPNIPFDKITFIVTERKCVDLSKEEQRSIRGMRDAADSQFVEFSDDLSLPFLLPRDCNVDGDFPSYSECKGRWKCLCQVAWDNYQDPNMIPGHFIMFGKDEFA